MKFGVMIILSGMYIEAPSRFRKGWMISIQKRTIDIRCGQVVRDFESEAKTR